MNWYLKANNASSIEEKIILTQVALESLSWIYFVEKEKIIALPEKFENLPATDKFTLFLSKLKIPLAIPSELQKLTEFASENNNWKNGAHAFTSIRNGLFHPKESKRKIIDKASEKVKYEAAMLGLWYLELIFLAMFDYHGIYHNRLNGKLEPVPWSKS